MKKIECVITEQIVQETEFIDLNNCYAFMAMKQAGLTNHDLMRDIYVDQLIGRPSTCGNEDFTNDLCALDRIPFPKIEKHHKDNEFNMPDLPLIFKIKIPDHEQEI